MGGMATADLLLHPVRLRIVQAFLGDRALTTSELSAALSDVPAGSLYRHVARLVKAGVLAVVAERRIRGAVERTYVLRLSAASIGPDELAAMSADDHRQAFLAFVAGLLGDFDRYLARGDIDLLRDGVTYRLAGMWLDDSEYLEVARELTRLLQPRLANLPTPGRKRWLLGTVVIPADETGPAGLRPDRPAPRASGPADPGPDGPGPADPGPDGPGPADPGPDGPEPADPEPDDPGPADPGPENPGRYGRN
jgi:Helix-turn-helix domain